MVTEHYERMFEEVKATTEQRIDERRKRLDELYQYGKRLDNGPLFEMNKREAEQVAAAIEQLTSDLEPLHQMTRTIAKEMDELKIKIADTQAAMKTDNGRRKAMALSKLIERIELTFTQANKGRRKSVLSAVKIIPRKPDLPVKMLELTSLTG